MRTVHTTAYKMRHGTTPKGRGNWGFRNLRTGEVVRINAAFSTARKQLDAGDWLLLP